MSFKGKVFKYGENVNTDVIFPGKYTYTIQDPHEMAQHAMEDLDPDFCKTVKEGDFIVAGSNFGCGSSREQAATCLKFAGISAIVAKSHIFLDHNSFSLFSLLKLFGLVRYFNCFFVFKQKIKNK